MNVTSLKTVDDRGRVARRKERTRQDLLAAATRVLAARGFHDTKIADIAGAADVAVGTFYLHFATKDALFAALVDDTITRLKAAIDDARRSETDPIERVRRSHRAFCRFADENREVFHIVFGLPAAYHDEIRRAQTLFVADVEDTLRAGIASGAFAPLPTAAVAHALVGMATQILSWWATDGSLPIDTLEETLNRLALHGVVRPPHDGKDPH
jgi:AcrR family transcriptional regulator